jgi:phosphoglycolate phosphatase
MSAFEVIVFDYDGTLYDTRPAIIHCIQRAFETNGRPIPARDPILGTVRGGLPLQETFVVLDETLRGNPAALDVMVKTYRTLYLEEARPLLRPFPGVRETLAQIYAAGIKCAVVSNKGVAAIRQSLDESGLSSFVDLVYGDEAGRPKKPDAAVLTDHILPRFAQLQKDRFLMVGDTETDILFAKRSGIAACWVSYGYGVVDRCRKLAPEHEIAAIEELPALVQSGQSLI